MIYSISQLFLSSLDIFEISHRIFLFDYLFRRNDIEGLLKFCLDGLFFYLSRAISEIVLGSISAQLSLISWAHMAPSSATASSASKRSHLTHRSNGSHRSHRSHRSQKAHLLLRSVAESLRSFKSCRFFDFIDLHLIWLKVKSLNTGKHIFNLLIIWGLKLWISILVFSRMVDWR